MIINNIPEVMKVSDNNLLMIVKKWNVYKVDSNVFIVILSKPAGNIVEMLIPDNDEETPVLQIINYLNER